MGNSTSPRDKSLETKGIFVTLLFAAVCCLGVEGGPGKSPPPPKPVLKQVLLRMEFKLCAKDGNKRLAEEFNKCRGRFNGMDLICDFQEGFTRVCPFSTDLSRFRC